MADVILKNGLIAYNEKRYNDALKYFKKLKDDKKEYYMGLAYVRRGDPLRAIRSFDRALTSDKEPDFRAAAFYQRGLAYTLPPLKDYGLAIENYDRAIKLIPQDESLFQQRGLAYARQGNYGRAVKDYDQAIHLNPEYAVAFYRRGMAYSRREKFSRAIEDFDQAIELTTAGRGEKQPEQRPDKDEEKDFFVIAYR